MPVILRARRYGRLGGGAALIGTLLALSGCGGSTSASYELQASFHNLDVSGLALSVDGAPLSVAAGTTTQTLAAALASGTPYTVGIATEPAAETCAVANGSGTMGKANVTNVAVSCVTNTYPVAGTIAGLTADGLVLLDNGADATPISANATHFTMPTAIAYGGNYAVTIQDQPAGLACSIAGGTGTMGASGTTVAITCIPNTYPVSGTITGLTNGGLVLLDNGADATPIGANAAQFMMPTPIPYGSTYSITIQTQPTGLTCAIAGGSGTMGLGGATVAVSCSTNTYTVGGTISGLTAGGLVLLDNGADASGQPASTAHFTMPTPIAYGSAYGVTVQSQPTGLVCSVSNGTGTMGAGDVINVAITCEKNTTVLYFFQGGGDGTDPVARLLQGTDGNFYGITNAGGTSGDGTVFEVTPAGVETVLHTFSGADGRNPQGGLIEDASGNFFGTSVNGGSSGFGTAFELAANRTETVLHSFTKSGDGGYPICSLVADGSGNFYGTTWGGGATHGIVFKVTSGRAETVLHSFANNSSDGGYPTAGLTAGSDGNYYGTTNSGGSANKGTVFKITPSGAETLLYTFTGGSDGGNPQNPLIQGSDGNFYGTTTAGGAHGDGAVFEITPSGTETVVYSFAGGTGDGSDPAAGLLQASDGNFYGTTNQGGSNGDGTVFEVTAAGVETVIYSFAGGASDGAAPSASLIEGSDGKLYGTTSAGGPNGYGTVFTVTLH
ncbi:MAG TPA: choice-of-anchor tandem repeat GloVer-containing protein [Steroidobacteraceae bacterium]|nr:choice-of-anchor tandem repeat GloVer-containing protein [Steroidobacteraceae bacterium]